MAMPRDRARAQRRAGNSQPAAQNSAQIQLRLGTAEQRNEDQPAVIGQRFDFARQIIAGNHIENDIDAAAGCFFF